MAQLVIVRSVPTAVEQLQVGTSGLIGTDMVEYGDEVGILLAVHFLQFYGDEAHFLEYFGREEIRRRVVTVQDFSFVRFDNRFQLEYISDKQ